MEEMEIRFKRLKPITLKALIDKRACLDGVINFIKEFYMLPNWDEQYEPPFEDIIALAGKRRDIPWLKANRFIQEIITPVCSIGDRFLILGESYILAQTGPRLVSLVSLKEGNRWEEGKIVLDVCRITMEEFTSMLGSVKKEAESIYETRVKGKM